jgi:hypothetical protein
VGKSLNYLRALAKTIGGGNYQYEELDSPYFMEGEERNIPRKMLIGDGKRKFYH